MEKLMYALNLLHKLDALNHPLEHARFRVTEEAERMLVDAANSCGLPAAEAMVILLAKAVEVRS